ncbi:Histone deacetylase 6 [Nymphon striatum]|nr:Histone deacetylase 6 [Nymphon striatum]
MSISDSDNSDVEYEPMESDNETIDSYESDDVLSEHEDDSVMLSDSWKRIADIFSDCRPNSHPELVRNFSGINPALNCNANNSILENFKKFITNDVINYLVKNDSKKNRNARSAGATQVVLKGKMLKYLQTVSSNVGAWLLYYFVKHFKRIHLSCYLLTGLTFDHKMGLYNCPWNKQYKEKPERFTESIKKCEEYRLIEKCVIIPSRKATEEELYLQHSAEHIALMSCVHDVTSHNKLIEISSKFDSVCIGPNVNEATLLSVGSLINLVDKIHGKEVENGMAIIRPPGHHALSGEIMGYCFYNNVAIAVQHLINKGLERVLIVDWDLHHGNGIQNMFYKDQKWVASYYIYNSIVIVLYISIHAYLHGEFWPNLREADVDYCGTGRGSGYNINIPINKTGTGNGDYLAIFHQIILPVAYEFAPQFVMVSSGYDACIGDLKEGMSLTPPFYCHMVSSLMALADGQLCIALEGGYHIPSLSEGVALTLKTLLGDPCPSIGPLSEPDLCTLQTIADVADYHRNYWHCFSLFPSNLQDHGDIIIKSQRRIFKGKSRRELKFDVFDDDLIDYEIASQVGIVMQNTNLTFPSIRTCLISDFRMANHVNYMDKSHPERPERLRRIYAQHKDMGLVDRCFILKPRFAKDSELMLVHSETHLKLIQSLDNVKPRDVCKIAQNFNSVYLCKDTNTSAKLAVGCLLEVVDSVLSNKSRSGVAIIRPPGHHAEKDKPMGFCIYDNVAIAAKYAMKNYNLSRILILDWDVHHGNGIQHEFESSKNILYISIHRYDNGFFFPASRDGNYNVTGTGEGRGYNVNIPWNKSGMGDVEYMTAFFQVVLPIAHQFNPELVLVSAGFDAAAGDPLGGCNVTPEGYAQMTHFLSQLAEGKIIIALEGGYNLTAISNSMCSCTKVLLGDPCPQIDTSVMPNASAIKSIRNVLKSHCDFWSRLKVCDEMLFSSLEETDSSTSSNSPSSESVQSDSENNGNESDEGLMHINEKLSQVANKAIDAECQSSCPHILQYSDIVPENIFKVHGICMQCGTLQDNWICLSCYKIYCEGEGHIKAHEQDSGHELVMSMGNSTVWCFLANALCKMIGTGYKILRIGLCVSLIPSGSYGSIEFWYSTILIELPSIMRVQTKNYFTSTVDQTGKGCNKSVCCNLLD